MSGMYSIAVSCFWWEQPAAAIAISAIPAAPVILPPHAARLDTEHPNVDRAGRLQHHEDPSLVPVGTDLGDPEPEAVVRQIAIQDRLAVIRKTAGHEERRERHRPAEKHPALEGDRDEGRKGDHRLPADVDRPVV